MEVYNNNDNVEIPVYAIYNYWGNIPGTAPPPDSLIRNVAYKPWLAIPEPEGEQGQATAGRGYTLFNGTARMRWASKSPAASISIEFKREILFRVKK